MTQVLSFPYSPPPAPTPRDPSPVSDPDAALLVAAARQRIFSMRPLRPGVQLDLDVHAA